MSDEAGVDTEDTESKPKSESGSEPSEAAPNGESETGADGAEGLAARVAAYDEDLAAEVAETEARAADLEERVDDLEATVKRTKADFQNYKKRTERRREREKARATEDLVSRLTEVRDNLVRALDQGEGTDIRPGVESTLETFDRVLGDENVTVIEPTTGDEVDPERHEVMMRVDSDRPEGTVVDVYQPGYEMADRVIEAAQVTVSNGSGA